MRQGDERTEVFVVTFCKRGSRRVVVQHQFKICLLASVIVMMFWVILDLNGRRMRIIRYDNEAA